MGQLEGRVALVTGAGRGIGRGIARAMAREGAAVALVERDAGAVADAEKELRGLGARALAIHCDIGSRDACEQAVAGTVAELGGLDVLVNNAMVNPEELPLVEISDAAMEACWKVGPMASFWLMQAAHPQLRARGGSVICMVSGAGSAGLPGQTAYAAAKEAVRGLSRVAAREWASEGITVNWISPFARSEGVAELEQRDPRAFARLLRTIPAGRLADCERDVGRVAVFLASDAARMVTGQTLWVDGGSGFTRD